MLKLANKKRPAAVVAGAGGRSRRVSVCGNGYVPGSVDVDGVAECRCVAFVGVIYAGKLPDDAYGHRMWVGCRRQVLVIGRRLLFGRVYGLGFLFHVSLI